MDSSNILSRSGTLSIFKICPPKQHFNELRSGILVRGRATTEAVESLKAQLHSQNKLTTLNTKIKKNRHEN
jgi:hypothetical protein